MYLRIKQLGSVVGRLKFKEGPVYIGRQMGSQVFLPDKDVSRQHAVFYTDKEGNWILEDLGSTNKTFIGDDAVNKYQVNDGDIIRIADFTIEVNLDPARTEEQLLHSLDTEDRTIHLEDTIAAAQHELVHAVKRDFKGANASPVKIPTKRIKDFAVATDAICGADDIKQLHNELLDILLRQFAGFSAWVALRRDDLGPMETQGGRKVTRESVILTELAEQQCVAEAMTNLQYILVPQMAKKYTRLGLRSAIIAPIVRKKECDGVLYVDNSTKHEHYSMMDLDYLVLLAIHTAAVLKRL